MKTREESDSYNDFLSVKDLTTFSDAIFAFAITLLVIDIRVPEIAGNSGGMNLNLELIKLIPRFIGFILTFMIGCLYWISYRRVLNQIKRVDGRLVMLNILFLMFVVLLPFPNDLLGRYQNINVSAVIEAVVLASIGIILGIIWIYASSGHRLVDKALSEKFIKNVTLRLFVSPAVFILSIPFAFVFPFYITVLVWVATLPLNMILQKRLFPGK